MDARVLNNLARSLLASGHMQAVTDIIFASLRSHQFRRQLDECLVIDVIAALKSKGESALASSLCAAVCTGRPDINLARTPAAGTRGRGLSTGHEERRCHGH